MSRLMKRISALLLTVFMICGVMAVPVMADNNALNSSSDLNFDVVFVMDGSGSMDANDPNHLVSVAGSMFLDLSIAEKSRAGYVVYSHMIRKSQELVDISDSSLKTGLSDIQYIPEDDTDISLGLTEGLRILKNGNSLAGGRKPMIILLSDGNTDLPDGPRTVAESEAELEQTISELKTLGIPVHAVGLNGNGTMDTAVIEKIANETGGSAHFPTRADELSDIYKSIFGEASGGDFIDLPAYYDPDTGRWEVDFGVENESIYAVNISIMTQKGVSDPQITGPDGSMVMISEQNGVSVANGTGYAVIKIKKPAKGLWHLSIKGDEADAIDVSMISLYDIAYITELDQTECPTNTEVRISSALYEGTDVVQDDDLVEGAIGTFSVKNASGAYIVQDAPLDFNAATYEFNSSYKFKESGTYYITCTLNGKDGSFTKESAPVELKVKSIPITLTKSSLKKTLFTAPFGSMGNTIELADLAQWDPNAELTYDFSMEDGTVVSASSDQNVIELKALKTGSDAMKIRVADQFGSSANLYVNVKVMPGWLIILGIVLLIVIIVVMILIIYKVTRPKLTGEVMIDMALPQRLANLTPGECKLVFPVKKTRMSLIEAIQLNHTVQSRYMDGIQQANLMALLQNIELVAAKKGSITLMVSPKIPGTVEIDNVLLNGGKKASEKPLIPGSPVVIRYSSPMQNMPGMPGMQGRPGMPGQQMPGMMGGMSGGMQEITTLTIWIEDQYSGGGFGGNGTPFGGDNGPSFGGDNTSPFGGGNDTPFGNQNIGGFEGFGSPDNGGFGGFGGNGQNNNAGGGFGGFGGNGQNNNAGGGFGGFGGNGQNNNAGGGFGGFGGNGQNNNAGGGFGGFGGNGQNNNAGGGFGGFDGNGQNNNAGGGFGGFDANSQNNGGFGGWGSN